MASASDFKVGDKVKFRHTYNDGEELLIDEEYHCEESEIDGSWIQHGYLKLRDLKNEAVVTHVTKNFVVVQWNHPIEYFMDDDNDITYTRLAFKPESLIVIEPFVDWPDNSYKVTFD